MAVDFIGNVIAFLQGLGLIDTGGSPDWTSYKDIMPDGEAVDSQAVSFYHTGGETPNPGIEARYPTFQVRVRGDSAAGGATAAKAKMEQIFLALRDIADQTLDSVEFAYLTPLGDLFSLGQDDQGRNQFTRNFRTAINN